MDFIYDIPDIVKISNKDGETNYFGESVFVDNNGKSVNNIEANGKVLVLNFPGSGLAFHRTDTKSHLKETISTIQKARDASKEMADVSGHNGDSLFYTAIYDYKADMIIPEYNNQNSNIHSIDIFNKTIAPLLNPLLTNKNEDEAYKQTQQNLQKLVLRGHCIGCVVVCELEKLLENKLNEFFKEKSEKNAREKIKGLLSMPTALLSSPPLKIEKYPKYFKTTAIVNYSDKIIAKRAYAGKSLKKKLRKLSGFIVKKDRRFPFALVKDVRKRKNYKILPEIKIVRRKLHDNVDLYISNRSVFPKSYNELKAIIDKRLKERKNDDEAYRKQIKKWIKGHEYHFFPQILKKLFVKRMTDAIEAVKKENNQEKECFCMRKVQNVVLSCRENGRM